MSGSPASAFFQSDRAIPAAASTPATNVRAALCTPLPVTSTTATQEYPSAACAPISSTATAIKVRPTQPNTGNPAAASPSPTMPPGPARNAVVGATCRQARTQADTTTASQPQKRMLNSGHVQVSRAGRNTFTPAITSASGNR